LYFCEVLKKSEKMKPFGFPKNEHLTGKKAIENLFENGKSVMDFPLRAVFCTTKEHNTAKILVSVPKKHFKRAVWRNYHKRLIRESYRLNKQIVSDFLVDKDYGLNVAITLGTSEKQNFLKISEKTIALLNKIILNLQ